MDNYSVHASVIEEVKTEDEDIESLHKDSKGVEVDLEGHEAAVGSIEPIAASRSLQGLAHPRYH